MMFKSVMPFYYAWILLVLCCQATNAQTIRIKQEGLDLSLNEINLLHQKYPDAAGTNMVLSIKETGFDTTDADLKNRYLSILPPDFISPHATNMASIAAGGANTDPQAKGAAWDAFITSADSKNLLPDSYEVFLDNAITVQNHSYGTGIENYYGHEAQAYDEFCTQLPHVMHVFSSGNEGLSAPSSGTYTGLAGWANLSGELKQSKNTITVAALDSTFNGYPFNSSGPAYDGRIKPEVAVYGHGGSSGAAALLSGVSILLQEAYQKQHQDSLLSSALLKAILVNTVRDMGTPGPDFHFGHGSVRAVEAYETILENRFMTGMCSKNASVEINLVVPINMARLSLTLAWTDPASTLNVAKSLVNDLDLKLEENFSGNISLPWILNSDPNADSLQLKAVKGIDTLNNIEKINLDFPSPGLYTIRVEGKNMQTSNQPFALAWNWEPLNSFEWTAPVANDPWLPDHNQVIRWKTTKNTTGKIEFKNVKDATWIPVNEDVDCAGEWLRWKTPVENGMYQLRWSDHQSVVHSDTFVIAPQAILQVAYACEDSTRIQWNGVKGADAYQVFSLGERHLIQQAITIDTYYVFSSNLTPNPFYAVAPLLADQRGMMSKGIDIAEQEVGCILNQFFFREIQNDKAIFQYNLGWLTGIKSISLFRIEGNDTIEINAAQPPVQFTNFIQSDPLQEGPNYFQLKIELENGRIIPSQVEVVFYLQHNQELIWPNPLTGGALLHIYSSSLQVFDVELVDLTGKRVLYFPYQSNPAEIPLPSLASGIYLVMLRYELSSPVARKIFVR